MAKMTQRMKEVFEKHETVPLATTAKDGTPNVVPVTLKKILDDETILVSDQFLNKTLQNMKDNAKATITAWDGVEGYQFKGTVTIETSGPCFEETAQWVDDVAKSMNLNFKSKGAVILKINEIFSVSPGPDAGKKVS